MKHTSKKRKLRSGRTIKKRQVSHHVTNNIRLQTMLKNLLLNARTLSNKNQSRWAQKSTFPVSGSELPFLPDSWKPWNQKSNCYMYAFNEKKACSKTRITGTPGSAVNWDTSFEGTCSDLAFRLLADHFLTPKMVADMPVSQRKRHLLKLMRTYKNGQNNATEKVNVFLVKPKQACPRGFYKTFMMMALNPDGSLRDYHFARQDPDGFFSHKRGWTNEGPIRVDASGKRISDPLTADWDYAKGDPFGLNYSKPCSFFCMRKKTSD